MISKNRLIDLRERITDVHIGINGEDLHLLYQLLPVVDALIDMQTSINNKNSAKCDLRWISIENEKPQKGQFVAIKFGKFAFSKNSAMCGFTHYKPTEDYYFEFWFPLPD